MSKLSLETKVKVKQNLVVDEFYGGLRFHNGMSKHIDEMATIKAIPHYNSNAYQIDIDTEGYDWTPEMFEVVS